jgi:MerR family redox-sensitive transcriptional activator SoxR
VLSILSIGDVAEKVDLNPSTLRFYEKMSLIPKPLRIGGQRRYESNVIGRIELIKIAQRAGFRISEIQFLLNGFDSDVPPSDRWKAMAVNKRMELEEKILQIRTMQNVLENSLNCNCLSWDECFKNIQLSMEVKNDI